MRKAVPKRRVLGYALPKPFVVRFHHRFPLDFNRMQDLRRIPPFLHPANENGRFGAMLQQTFRERIVANRLPQKNSVGRTRDATILVGEQTK